MFLNVCEARILPESPHDEYEFGSATGCRNNSRIFCMRTELVGFWHFSKVVIPMRDVRSWGRTGVRRETGKE